MPVICWLFQRSRATFALIAGASAFLCFTVVGISPKTAFFLLPFRLWEFMLGFGVARFAHNAPSMKRTFATWVGFASLVGTICMAFFPVNGQSLQFKLGHPGPAALLVAMLTAGALYF